MMQEHFFKKLRFTKLVWAIMFTFSVVAVCGQIYVGSIQSQPIPLIPQSLAPRGGLPPKEGPTTDVTIAGEGQKALHEGQKIRKGILKRGPYILPKDAEPGVNDIIRELRSNGFYRDLEGSDLESVAKQLAITGYTDLAKQVRNGEKKISVYQVDKSQLADTTAKERGEFVNGITTHAGIRTANIHITLEEYQRLWRLGGHMSVAARVIQEAYEVDAWREEAEKRGIKLGTISEEYDENWESGIRKWIIDSLADPTKRDEIIALDRKIHGEGLYREMTAMIQYMGRQQMTPSLKNLGDYLAGKANQLEQGDGILNTFRTEETRKEFVKLLIVMHPAYPLSESIVWKVLHPNPHGFVTMSPDQKLYFGYSLYFHIAQTYEFLKMPQSHSNERWKAIKEDRYSIREKIRKELDLERIQRYMLMAMDELTKLSAAMSQLGVITASQQNWIEKRLKSYESLYEGIPEFPLRLQGFVVDQLKRTIALVRNNLRMITIIDIGYIPPTYRPSFTDSFSDPSDIVLAMKEVRHRTYEGKSSRYRIDPQDIIDLFFSTEHSYERDTLLAEIVMEQSL